MILLASANKTILFHWEQAILDFSTLSTCHHFDSLFDKLKRTDPEILLLDYELPGFNHSHSIADIVNLHKNLKIIVFSPELPGETEWNLFKAGVKGCCPSDMPPQQISRVIQVVKQGDLWIRRSLTSQILNELVRVTNEKNRVELAINQLLENLTRREYEIAMLVGYGESNKRIAQRLAITERTVKAHLTEIFRKLRISDRIKLALIMKDAVKS